MKSFLDKNAMTLVELIISTAISAVVLLIVFTFIVDTMDSIATDNIKTEGINDSFTFKSKFDRYYRGGYFVPYLVGTGANDVILLHNEGLKKSVIFGIVNLDLMKLEKNYVYGNNVLGYRELSESETTDVFNDNSLIYNMSFFNDKVFKKMKVKDFSVDLYNGGNILDVYISVINFRSKLNYGVNYNDFILDKQLISKYNLVF